MSDVRVEVSAGVMELTLARPAKKNALTQAMYQTMIDGLAQAEADPAIQCVLFRAEGSDFCAGNDLNDFISAGAGAVGTGGPILRFLHALSARQVVLAAAVQGRAVGIGATLLLHCDLVAAAPDASLSMPFVRIGLTPEAGSSLLVPARVGPQVAAEMLLLGRPIAADRALALGLINEVSDDPVGAARALALEVARQPPGALRAAHDLLRLPPEGLDARIDREAEIFMRQLATPEFQAMAQAFFAQRQG